MTYEEILKSALEGVPNIFDKRKGSIMYLSMAPVSYELAKVYAKLDSDLNGRFASGAEGKELDLICADLGVVRKPATYAVRLGVFNIDVPVGYRFGIEGVTYYVSRSLGGGRAELTCEQLGDIGNLNYGSLLPLSYVKGLSTAEISDIIFEGTNEEPDTDLRNRYFLHIRTPATSGNVYHYQQWALEVPGVSGAKVFPLWNGPGTVKVVVADSNMEPASDALIDTVFEQIEKQRPIGAQVSVEAPERKTVDVAASVVLSSGVYLPEVKAAYKEKLTEYIRSTVFKQSFVSHAIVGSLLLNVDGVVDYSGLTLNGTAANVAVGSYEVPVLGNVEVSI